MEERERADHRPSGVEDPARVRAQVVDAVGEHHALGVTRGPAGEEDDVRSVLTKPDVSDVAVVFVAGGGQQPGERHQRGPHLGCHDARVRPSLVDDQEGRPGGQRRVHRLLHRQSGVHRREHGAHLRQRREERDVVEVGGRPDGDPIPMADAELLHRPRHSVANGIDLAEGDRAWPEHGRRTVGYGAGRVPEHVPDQQLHPP